jgi:TPP-dependent 2-oxoacid decarboxylase
MAAETRKCTVAEYLARRIAEMGIRHLFAVPGNFCADFLMEAEHLGAISVIGTTNELEAGYAADAYSRLAGLGAACVTHGVGALSLLNAARKGCSSATNRSGCIGVPLRVADSRLSSARSTAIVFRILVA